MDEESKIKDRLIGVAAGVMAIGLAFAFSVLVIGLVTAIVRYLNGW